MATTTWNSNLDLLLNELQNAVLQSLATNPSGVPGRIYYNSADGSLRWYDGAASAWQSVGTGSGYTDEEVRDVVGAMVQGGTGIDVTVDDENDTLTISVAGLGIANISGLQSALDGKSNVGHTHVAADITDFTSAARSSISVTDTATLDLNYSGGAISGAVLNSPTVGGQTPAQLRARSSHTGTQSADTLTDGSTNRLYSTAEKTKLAGIATGATANATDAQLRDRSTHTGTQLANTISNFDAQVRTSRLDQMATPSAAVAMGGQKITGLADGTASTDAATFGQLTAAIQGMKWKEPVRIATTANRTLSGLTAIDGVTPVAGDRVLVKNQTTASANGIYIAASGAWTRATDADTAAELNGATVIVLEGTEGQGDIYSQTANIVTVGTTAQTWIKVGEGNSTYTSDGTTVELVGNSFRIAASAAGSGLVGGGGSALAVNTGTGLEIVSDAVRLASSAAGNGLTGGGGAALAIGAGTGITVGATTVGIANGGVGVAQLSTAVAGNGLTGGGGTALAVNVDNTTLEISSNVLRVKANTFTGRHQTTWTGSGTSLTVTHNLGQRWVHVSVYDAAGALLHGVAVTATSATQCTLEVNSAPGASAWTVVVVG